MNLKTIIITVAVGLVVFGASFGFSFMRGKLAAAEAAIDEAKQQPQEPVSDYVGERLKTQNTPAEQQEDALSLSLTEKQLEGLIYEVREKIREYDKKTLQLKSFEERVQTARSQMQKDVEELADLQTELASTVAALKQERQRLLDTRLEISKQEQQNFSAIAATYDKMKPDGATKIFSNMCKLKADEAQGFNDVVRILYYMSDRSKAKVLETMVNTEPKLAAVLSQELKRTREVAQ